VALSAALAGLLCFVAGDLNKHGLDVASPLEVGLVGTVAVFWVALRGQSGKPLTDDTINTDSVAFTGAVPALRNSTGRYAPFAPLGRHIIAHVNIFRDGSCIRSRRSSI
jgi:hypothetical protein